MLRVLINEFVTGGGAYERPDLCTPSFLQEGGAMLRSVAADFAALRGVEVVTLRDSRLSQSCPPAGQMLLVEGREHERELLGAGAASADWTVVIAPEIDGLLLDRCSLVVQSGGRLLGSSLACIELTSNKQALAEHWKAHDVPTPAGIFLPAGSRLPVDFAYPGVLKPVDGAGSWEVRLIANAEAAAHVGVKVPRPSRLERFYPGIAASAAMFCGPGQRVVASPCRQLLSEDGLFRYLGGSLPLPAPLAERARRLAGQAIAALPSPLGCLGVDLVLGTDPAGADDVAIEINPRFTTSYVGLRAAASGNLADAVLQAAAGLTPRLEFRDEPLRFTPDGRVSKVV